MSTFSTKKDLCRLTHGSLRTQMDLVLTNLLTAFAFCWWPKSPCSLALSPQSLLLILTKWKPSKKCWTISSQMILRGRLSFPSLKDIHIPTPRLLPTVASPWCQSKSPRAVQYGCHQAKIHTSQPATRGLPGAFNYHAEELPGSL